MVCSSNARIAEIFNPAPVVIPRLSSRSEDIDRLIDEYLGDAISALGMAKIQLSPEERAWIRRRSADSLADIQRATLRLAAIHQAGSISAGGIRIGISHTAMLKWMRNRKFSPSWLRASSLEDDSDLEPLKPFSKSTTKVS